jgi:hypothetical protein
LNVTFTVIHHHVSLGKTDNITIDIRIFVINRYKNDYGGQISNVMSVDVLRPIWNSYKYKIEATIPEPNICTDCILSRLTIINVEASDLGSYIINATTNDKPYRTALDSVFVYGLLLNNDSSLID